MILLYQIAIAIAIPIPLRIAGWAILREKQPNCGWLNWVAPGEHATWRTRISPRTGKVEAYDISAEGDIPSGKSDDEDDPDDGESETSQDRARNKSSALRLLDSESESEAENLDSESEMGAESSRIAKVENWRAANL